MKPINQKVTIMTIGNFGIGRANPVALTIDRARTVGIFQKQITQSRRNYNASFT